MQEMAILQTPFFFFLFFAIGFSTLALGKNIEKPRFFLKLTTEWRVEKSQSDFDHDWRIYLKKGENPFYYREVIKVETRTKSSLVTVSKVEETHKTKFLKIGCKVSRVVKAKDGKRSMLTYACAKKKRSGAMLTVESDDDKVHSIFYEMPKENLAPEDKERLIGFLDENAKICDSFDRTQCVR